MKLLVLIAALCLATTVCFAENKPQSKKTWSTIAVEPSQYHLIRQCDHWRFQTAPTLPGGALSE
jgi:hypothetical protein